MYTRKSLTCVLIHQQEQELGIGDPRVKLVVPHTFGRMAALGADLQTDPLF